MPALQPLKKIEEFYRELDEAKLKSEIKELLKKAETFAKMHPSDEAFILVARIYLALEDERKAVEWIEKTQTFAGKLEELIIKINAGMFAQAYKLAKFLHDKAPSKEAETVILFNKLLIFISTYNFEEAKNLLDKNREQIKQFIVKAGKFELLNYIQDRMEEYTQAKKLIEDIKELREIEENINLIVMNTVKTYRVVPRNYRYLDFGDTELVLYIIVPENIDRQELEKIENEIIEKISFKYKHVDFSFSFVKAREEDINVLSNWL